MGSAKTSAMATPPARDRRSAERFRFSALPPLTLYVHIPWCTRKCPYCDFNSHQAHDAIPEDAYLDALNADLEQDIARVWGRTVNSVFIGGGTPSLFTPAAIARLLSDLRARLPLAPGLEVTMEANPGTLERGCLAEIRSAGVNRLSLGVQSFDDRLLERIGRIHDGAAARRAVEAIHAAGFDTWNIDLMYGLPGQTLEQAGADLTAALALQPPHLSHYQLTLEPNTPFHHRPPSLPGDDALWEMQRLCQQQMAGDGHLQYEVSAYAKEGHQCRHNLNYWRFGDYLGIGAGAHAKVTDASAQTVTRISKVRHPRDYLDRAVGGDCVATHAELGPSDVALEFMMNALRLNEGFALALYAERTGLPLAFVEESLHRAEALGLIERKDVKIRPTGRGRRYLNELLTLFVPES